MTSTEVSNITIEQLSGRVYLNGKHVGTIHYPYEENRQRVRRSTWKVVMCGRSVGTYRTYDAAQDAARQWQPTDEIDRMVYADQRAHEVAWMTAEERNEYDRIANATLAELARWETEGGTVR